MQKNHVKQLLVDFQNAYAKFRSGNLILVAIDSESAEPLDIFPKAVRRGEFFRPQSLAHKVWSVGRKKTAPVWKHFYLVGALDCPGCPLPSEIETMNSFAVLASTAATALMLDVCGGESSEDPVEEWCGFLSDRAKDWLLCERGYQVLKNPYFASIKVLAALLSEIEAQELQAAAAAREDEKLQEQPEDPAGLSGAGEGEEAGGKGEKPGITEEGKWCSQKDAAGMLGVTPARVTQFCHKEELQYRWQDGKKEINWLSVMKLKFAREAKKKDQRIKKAGQDAIEDAEKIEKDDKKMRRLDHQD